MKNKDIVKNQHIVPQGYLKNFSTNRKVYAYNIPGRRYMEIDYKDTCYRKYAYETSKSNVNNKIEKQLKKLEDECIPEIDVLLSMIKNDSFDIDEVDSKLLCKFMWLQHLRTDNGRILFMNHLFGGEPASKPLTFQDIKNKEEMIKQFNVFFNEEDQLEVYLDKFVSHIDGSIRIGKTNNIKLITSDSPVYIFYLYDEIEPEALKVILPISPTVHIYFILPLKHKTCLDKGVYSLKNEYVLKCNKATINLANNWIISSEPFTVDQINLIYRKHYLNEDYI